MTANTDSSSITPSNLPAIIGNCTLMEETSASGRFDRCNAIKQKDNNENIPAHLRGVCFAGPASVAGTLIETGGARMRRKAHKEVA